MGTDDIDLYTSTDGITWTVSQAGVIGSGAAGTWDSNGVHNSAIIQSGGTVYVWYDAQGQFTGGVGYNTGVATANGTFKPLSKFAANPTNGFAGAPTTGIFVAVVNGKYWFWGQNSSIPTNIWRAIGDSPQDMFQAFPQVPTFSRGISVGEGDQVADPCLVEVNGQTFMYYSAVDTGQSFFGVKLAIASMTMAQLVTTQEGMTSSSP